MDVKEKTSIVRFEIEEAMGEYDETEKTSIQAVEVELLPPIDINDQRKVEIYKNIADIDERLDEISARVEELNSEIDTLTNHAEGIDYAVAVASGILTGLIDSFLVGEWSFEEAKDGANEIVNKQIIDYARMCGYEGSKDADGKIRYPLEQAIGFLEKKFGVSQDNIWSGKGINVSAVSHHLDDLAHHPTPLGLVSAIVVQFLRVGLFINRNGKWHFEKVDTDPRELIKTWTPTLLFGLTTWIVNVIEKKSYEDNNVKIPEPILKLIKTVSAVPMMFTILKTANNWYGHLMSDKAGSKHTPGGGMGIPGLAMSLMKELSMIPGLVFPAIPKNLAKLYEKGIGTEKGQVDLGIFNCLFEEASSKFDSRTEKAIGSLLGKQAIPVIINGVLVRGFYFIRHFTEELKRTSNISEINWSKTKPFGNRTIERMMTISTGTLMAVDVADAAIRSGGFNANCILRINFVGVGRFAIAVGADVGMGIKKDKKENDRMILRGEELQLLRAKVFYKEADVWLEAEKAGKSLQEVHVIMESAVSNFFNAWKEIEEGSERRKKYVEDVVKNHPGLANEISGIIEWGINDGR